MGHVGHFRRTLPLMMLKNCQDGQYSNCTNRQWPVVCRRPPVNVLSRRRVTAKYRHVDNSDAWSDKSGFLQPSGVTLTQHLQ
ncbi:hypothetical protein GDO78_014460 [Eleutherodactylus coqui]|uniref:Uncharacterized protein n=1 Tax=Eleutherodactylus coqui TaxID=57060 RepID=A0A8J6EEJ6_ELECQ|nr:hypothetical protein GDO78_014460 [Eleutherodactylus coqui]